MNCVSYGVSISVRRERFLLSHKNPSDKTHTLFFFTHLIASDPLSFLVDVEQKVVHYN